MPSRSCDGRGLVGRGHERRRVVLEPGQAPRAVEPDAAQEADLADRGADVGREPRARGQHQQHVARRRAQARRHEHDRADVARRRRPPRPARASSALAQRAAATGPYQRSQASRRSRDQARADAGDAHLLAGRRRGGRGEQVPGQAVGGRAALLGRALDARPPGRGEHRRAARTARAATSAGWIDTSSATVTPRRRIQPQVENSDMYMWSSTNTWSRSTESRSRYSGRSWCAMVATDACSRATCDSSAIVTWSRKRRCTRVLTDAQEPGGGGRRAEAERRRPRAAGGRRASTPSPSSLSQSARSASGSAASSDSANDGQQHPRLVPVAELAAAATSTDRAGGRSVRRGAS